MQTHRLAAWLLAGIVASSVSLLSISGPPPVAAAPTTASQVARSAAPVAEAARLRAQGPAALQRLLAEWHAHPDRQAALEPLIDAVAGQKYAAHSGLYWYTDLASATAAAHASGKPILSLRLLGDLREELSCANSRFFRTVLYPDPRVQEALQGYVLHWSSERPAPKVTIDFGDGRRLERTTTGNSIHYVMDAQGRVLDALPGMYAPSVFADELTRIRSVATDAGTLNEVAFIRHRDLHLQGQASRSDQQRKAAAGTRGYVSADSVGLPGRGVVASHLARAQRATMSKAMVEVPDLQVMGFAQDIGNLSGLNANARAVLGAEVFGLGDADLPPGDATGRATAAARGQRTGAEILTAPARTLVRAVAIGDLPAGARPSDAVVDRMVLALEANVAADTAINELELRPAVHRLISRHGSFDALNRDVYAQVFHSAASDPWMGLLDADRAYSGLRGDGVSVR